MNTFRHAGDLGDIIYSLPVVKSFGGGQFLIEAANYTRQTLTPDRWCGIDELLRCQPYIAHVREWRHREPVTHNLNNFRAALFKSMRLNQNKDKALVDWILDAHGVPREAKDEAWLTAPPVKVARVIINRTGPGRSSHHVYHNLFFPWKRVMDKYGESAVFIGTEAEHEAFCAAFGNIAHCVTGTIYDAARVIAGCDLFVGNQSVCNAIAEGMKKQIVLEVWREGPNCLHYRPGVFHGWDQNVQLPDLS
jgi:hypothetical protein